MALIIVRRGKPKEAELLSQEALQKCDFPEAKIKTYYCQGTTAIQRNDGPGALENYLKSLEICRNSHFKLSAILNIEGTADALRVLENYERSACFLSAAAAFRQEIGAPVSPWDLPVIEHLKSSLRTRLGKAAFSQAWSIGQDSDFNAVIEEALTFQAG
jgi:hypothetical protein